MPFFLIFFVFAVAFAFLYGGGPERLVATVYVLAIAATASVGFLYLPGSFRVVPLGLLATDAMLLVALCMIAIRANRWWPIPAAACQLTVVLAHLGKLVFPGMIPNGYAFLATIWSWPMTFLLIYGTLNYQRQRRAGTTVTDWKAFSRPRAH